MIQFLVKAHKFSWCPRIVNVKNKIWFQKKSDYTGPGPDSVVTAVNIASHEGFFRGARFSSLTSRDEKRAPLKTSAWEATLNINLANKAQHF